LFYFFGIKKKMVVWGRLFLGVERPNNDSSVVELARAVAVVVLLLLSTRTGGAAFFFTTMPLK